MRPGQGRPAPRRGGFTLIEMVVVMIVVAIIGAVVVPAIVQGPPVDRGAFAEPLLQVLRAAQRAAADSGRTVRLVIDPVTRQYVAEMAGNDTPLANGAIEAGAGFSMQTDSVRASITFEPSGTAMGDSILVRSGGRVAWVTVDPWTGAARAQTW